MSGKRSRSNRYYPKPTKKPKPVKPMSLNQARKAKKGAKR